MTKENKNTLNSSIGIEQNNNGVIKDIQTGIEINNTKENNHKSTIVEDIDETYDNKELKTKDIIDNEEFNNINSNNSYTIKDNYDKTFTLPLIGLIFFLGGYVSAGMGGILGIIIILALKGQDFDDERIVAIKEMINFFVSYLLWFFISAILCIVLIGFLMLIFFAIAGFIFSIVGLIKHLNNKSYVYPLSIDIMNVRK